MTTSLTTSKNLKSTAHFTFEKMDLHDESSKKALRSRVQDCFHVSPSTAAAALHLGCPGSSCGDLRPAVLSNESEHDKTKIQSIAN